MNTLKPISGGSWVRAVLIIILLLMVGAWVMWLKTQSAGPVQKRTRFLMDTYCTVMVPGPSDRLEIIDQVLDHIEKLDAKFDVQDPAGPIYAFNARNEPITDPDILDLVSRALEVSRASEGAFDITIYPVVDLWGFMGDSPQVPGESDLKARLATVGYESLLLQDGRLTKTRTDVRIDLGAIAKGYAVEQAVRGLRDAGIQNALIDFGGDVYALGTMNEKNWKVGIQDPRGKDVVGVLALSEQSTATSGDYERFFEEEGKRYHHLLDPRSGKPARGLLSLTVITPDAVLADAWSTAFFIQGAEWAQAYVQAHPGLHIVWVSEDRQLRYSAGAEKYLVRTGKR